MRSVSARLESFVATSPPSPATSGLVGVRLNTSATPNEPIGMPSMRGAERVRGVEQHRDAVLAAERFERAARSHGAPNTCVAMMALAPSSWRAACSGSIWKELGRHSTNFGTRPFHMTACADAENVKLGSTTGPGRPSVSACTTQHQPGRARAQRDDVRDAEALGDAGLELLDERAVGEHAALVRRLEPPHHAFERRAGGPGEGQAGREGGRAAEQRGQARRPRRRRR